MRAAKERGALGVGREAQVLRLELREGEGVDGRPHAIRGHGRRHGNQAEFAEGPVTLRVLGRERGRTERKKAE